MFSKMFVQMFKKFNDKFYVVKNSILLTKNSFFHFDDIRVVREIDIFALYHFKNAIILFQTKNKNIFNMCNDENLNENFAYNDIDEIKSSIKHLTQMIL